MLETPGLGGAKEALASLRPAAGSMTAYCRVSGSQRSSLNGLPLNTEPGEGAAGAGAYGSENMCQPAVSSFGCTVKLKELEPGRPVRAPTVVTVTECAPAPSGTRAVTRIEPEVDWTEATAALPSTETLTPLAAELIRRPRIEVEVVSTG